MNIAKAEHKQSSADRIANNISVLFLSAELYELGARTDMPIINVENSKYFEIYSIQLRNYGRL